jgi:hypothetical protein
MRMGLDVVWARTNAGIAKGATDRPDSTVRRDRWDM